MIDKKAAGNSNASKTTPVFQKFSNKKNPPTRRFTVSRILAVWLKKRRILDLEPQLLPLGYPDSPEANISHRRPKNQTSWSRGFCFAYFSGGKFSVKELEGVDVSAQMIWGLG